MVFNSIILLYALLALLFIVLVYTIKNLSKVRVWIKGRPKAGAPLQDLGYLQLDNDGTAGEVKLPGGGSKPSIARVVVDNQSNRNNGYVELITTDIDDDSVKPGYRNVGFIGFDNAFVDEYGIIYKQTKGKRKEKIGYTACPSKPNTPTIYGERSWKTLWLVCTLNAYFGTPDPEMDKQEEKKKNKKGKKNDENTEQTSIVTSTPSETPVPDGQGAVNAYRRINGKYFNINADAESGRDLSAQNDESDDIPLDETLEIVSPVEQKESLAKNDETSVEEFPEETNNPESDSTDAQSEVEPLKESAKESDEESQSDLENTDDELSETAQNNEDQNEETSTGETAQTDPVPEETNQQDEPESPTPDPIPVPEDPFEALSDDEKKRLDKVKDTYPRLFASIINNMVKVEGGTFIMGADPTNETIKDEDGKTRGAAENNESPKHTVHLSTYYINKFVVTQAEWRAVMGYNDSDCQDDKTYPVTPVSFVKAQEFILRLSYITGIKFALPTEAQWEFAARGGNRSRGTKFSGSDKFSDVGYGDHKHSVGQKQCNELGLYDMSGLVREWCSDICGLYSEEEQTDPLGPTEDSPLVMQVEGKLYHVVRSPSGNETVTNRKGEDPQLAKGFISYGFRLACAELPESATSQDDNSQKKQDDGASKTPPAIKQKGKSRTPDAVCHFTGFHSSKKDILPAEARACAYALLSQKFPRRKFSEYYKSKPYGWLDTALLTSMIFTVIYLGLYLFNTGILGFPLLGNDFWAVIILVAFYYLLWVLVRYVKIDCIENSVAFQPKLDLFNKNLGMGCMNWTVVILGLISIYFTYEYYDFDFIPLIWAIISGVALNMMLKVANKPWKISSTYNENDEEEEDDENEVKNPDGDIAKSFDWDLDPVYSAQKVHGNVTLYFNANEMSDLKQCNPFFAQRKDRKDEDYILDMFHFLKDHRPFLARLKYVVFVIDRIVKKQGLTPIDRMQFALDFIQEPNIKFVENKNSKIINYYEDYIRYPDETLYDGEGDSNSKSLLAAMMFHIMGFNVLYMISRKNQHAAIGIEVKKEDLEKGWYGNMSKIADSIVQQNGKYYIYCETTGDRFAIGTTMDGISLDDFDKRILLPLVEDDDEESSDEENDNIISRIYNWDLDPEFGKLHGNITLDFSENEMNELRTLNPFQTYGQDSNTYEMNIRSIFTYVFADASRFARVQTVADYIRKVITDAGLPEIALVQFALDFSQEPNIKYCVDENSFGINCAKEYMRFPDEVLFDKEGDCDCKSSLTCALYHALGYNVIIMLSQKLGHAAIGIEVNEDWLTSIKMDDPINVVREHNGKRYIYCETTGDGYKIGRIKEGESIQDFETIVEIPA